MRTKKGVILVGLHPKMQIANCKAAVVWAKYGQELVITAAVVDRESGFHPLGRACDYRTRYFTNQAQTNVVCAELREALGIDYDVVLEDDHIHVEFDPTNPKII